LIRNVKINVDSAHLNLSDRLELENLLKFGVVFVKFSTNVLEDELV